MNALIQHIVPYLLIYKYVSVFLIAFLAAVIVPVPSGSVLMMFAYFASWGYINIVWVVVLSILGNIAGDNLGYFLAESYGRKTLSRIGFRKVLESENFKTIERKFKKRPGLIIFVTRFEVVSTLSANLLAGISNVTYKKYLLYEILGTISQVLLYAGIGYFFGDNWEYINKLIGKGILGVVCLLILLFFVFRKKIFSNSDK
jgi:membrane protein DedA with SNARE-associated domain